MELSQTVALNGNMVRKFLSTLNFTLQSGNVTKYGHQYCLGTVRK